MLIWIGNSMIKIKLNDSKYQYDIFQIVSLFYDYEEIKFFDEAANNDFSFDISYKRIICSDNCEACDFEFSDEKNLKEQIKIAVFKFLFNKTEKELPWGTLVGIRPSKIALKLLNEGKSEKEIIDYYREHYIAKKDKAKLCIDIAHYESKIVNDDPKKISLYVGMPFCPTRCQYCSFASNPIGSCKKIVEPYLETLNHEINAMSEFIKEKDLQLTSIYFGGGTPTSVNDIQFENIMNSIYNKFVKDYNIQEFTVECGRPDSLTISKLTTMKKYEVGRISINPQTMNDDTLKLIGRNHTVKDVVEKFYMARELGFHNINMDIIVGLKGERLPHIVKTCEEIAKLKPDNITVHGLSIKRGSRLHEELVTSGKYKLPEQNEIISMFEETVKLAESLKLKPYYMYRQKNMLGSMENVGYAAHEKEGIYNIQMIEERQTIIALGADAVTKAVFLKENRIERFANVKDVREYIARIDEMIEKKKQLLNLLY